MVMVSVDDLREKLGEYLDRARAGEEVLVTEDGKPPVRMRAEEPEMTEEHRRERARMERLAAQGLVRLGTGRLPTGFWDWPRPQVEGNAAVEAVLADRQEREDALLGHLGDRAGSR